MKYINIGCKINCWECKRNCEIKSLLEFSIYIPDIEQIIYFNIIETLKAMAGQFIIKGIPIKELDEELKIAAVSFYVARLKLKEHLIPENQK